MRATALIAASLLAVSLAGCAGPKHDNDPDYDTGFTDGCSTGTARSSGTPVSKATRDQALWELLGGVSLWLEGGLFLLLAVPRRHPRRPQPRSQVEEEKIEKEKRENREDGARLSAHLSLFSFFYFSSPYSLPRPEGIT